MIVSRHCNEGGSRRVSACELFYCKIAKREQLLGAGLSYASHLCKYLVENVVGDIPGNSETSPCQVELDADEGTPDISRLHVVFFYGRGVGSGKGAVWLRLRLRERELA